MSDSSTSRKGQRPSRAEISLAVVAGVVVTGWILFWVDIGEFRPFSSTFVVLSFFGALLLLAYVALKPFGFVRLPEKIEQRLVPILSLVPLLGYLVSIITPIWTLLTVGGSIGLAYLSATTFWRKQFLDLASHQLTGKESDAAAEEGATVETPKEEASETPSEASDEDKKKETEDTTAG